MNRFKYFMRFSFYRLFCRNRPTHVKAALLAPFAFTCFLPPKPHAAPSQKSRLRSGLSDHSHLVDALPLPILSQPLLRSLCPEFLPLRDRVFGRPASGHLSFSAPRAPSRLECRWDLPAAGFAKRR